MEQPPRICVIDDDADVRESLRSFLRSVRVDVRVFQSAEEFLDSALDSEIDCIVTDLHMDGMGGIGLQEELKRSGCNYPLIIMTAFPSEETERRSAQLGVSAYLVKPVDPDALLECVENILG